MKSQEVISQADFSVSDMLMEAVKQGLEHVVEAALTDGANVNIKDTHGIPTIFFAIGLKRMGIIRILDRFGAVINKEELISYFKGSQLNPLEVLTKARVEIKEE